MEASTQETATISAWLECWRGISEDLLRRQRGIDYSRGLSPFDRDFRKLTRAVAEIGERVGIDTATLFEVIGMVNVSEADGARLYATVKRIEVEATMLATDSETKAVAAARANWFIADGDCWVLQFVDADGTVEAPSPFAPRCGFELLHALLYEPAALAREFPGSERTEPLADPEALCDARRQLDEFRAQRDGSSLERAEELDECIRKLDEHIARLTRPGGAQRVFTTDDRRARNRTRNAINDALKVAAKTAPRWAAHMRASIDFAARPTPAYRPGTPTEWRKRENSNPVT